MPLHASPPTIMVNHIPIYCVSSCSQQPKLHADRYEACASVTSLLIYELPCSMPGRRRVTSHMCRAARIMEVATLDTSEFEPRKRFV